MSQPIFVTVCIRVTTTARKNRPIAELGALFAEMIGSTALAQGMDPEDLREVIRGFQNAAAGAVVRFDGVGASVAC